MDKQLTSSAKPMMVDLIRDINIDIVFLHRNFCGEQYH